MIRLLLVGLVFACAVSITSCGTKSRQASGNSDTAAVAVSVADTATAVVPVYAKGYAVKHLPGNVFLQLFADFPGPGIGVVRKENEAEGIYHVSVQEDIQLHQLGGPVFIHLIVQGAVAPGSGL